jgi:hypothetical protein
MFCRISRIAHAPAGRLAVLASEESHFSLACSALLPGQLSLHGDPFRLPVFSRVARSSRREPRPSLTADDRADHVSLLRDVPVSRIQALRYRVNPPLFEWNQPGCRRVFYTNARVGRASLPEPPPPVGSTHLLTSVSRPLRYTLYLSDDYVL